MQKDLSWLRISEGFTVMAERFRHIALKIDSDGFSAITRVVHKALFKGLLALNASLSLRAARSFRENLS